MSDEAPGLAALEARTRALIASDTLTPPTRAALQARMDQSFEPSDLFSPGQRRTLEAACLRLIDEPELVRRIALPAAFEAMLARGLYRGWRYAERRTTWSSSARGWTRLRAAQASAAVTYADLKAEDQDALLTAACKGDPPMDGRALKHWFEELLTALAEIYYAHPLVQVSIGYDGMADAHGAQAVGFQAVAAEADRLGR